MVVTSDRILMIYAISMANFVVKIYVCFSQVFGAEKKSFSLFAHLAVFVIASVYVFLKISQPVRFEDIEVGNQSIVTAHLGSVSFIGAPGGGWA